MRKVTEALEEKGKAGSKPQVRALTSTSAPKPLGADTGISWILSVCHQSRQRHKIEGEDPEMPGDHETDCAAAQVVA